jgi:type IV pilus assembly protein PilM
VDEQSIWKKEISFRRKPKQKPEPEAVEETSETAPKESIWKKEISFGRKAKKAVTPVEPEPVEETPTPVPEPVAAAPVAADPEVAAESETHDSLSDPEPEPEQTVWKREVSFSRKVEAEPAAEEPAVEEPVAEEPVAAEPVAEEPLAAEPAAEEPVAEESAVEEPVAEEPVAEEPVAEEPVAEELVAEEPVSEEPAAEEPAAEEPVVEEPVAEEPVATESWSAKPSLPPAQIDQTPAVAIPTPEPAPRAAVVHPPVPAAELPPVPGEKVPFWKKEISFGGKKTPKAERAKDDGPRQPKERKQKEPKVKAERGGGKGAKRIVGLKIGASQLAAARVSNNGSAELQQVAREPLSPGIVVGGELRDPDGLAEALKAFFAKHNLPKRGIRLGIANNRIGVRTFEIAGIDDPKQLGNAIRFRAQEVLPIPIDEAVLDYQILGEGVDEEGQPTKRVLLVVAYRELIDRYVDACKKAGLGLVGIDLEAFALLRALQAPQDGAGSDPTAALVAVAIGHERSTFAVSDGRVCEFTRVLEWGGSALNVAIARVLNRAPSEVEEVKRALTLTASTVTEGLSSDEAAKAVEAVRKAVQTFARELVSSLQYYQNQPGSLGIGEIVLSGGTAHLPGLAAELEGLIGVRVRVGDPLARMKVSKKVGDPDQIGSLAVAIGLGIED